MIYLCSIVDNKSTIRIKKVENLGSCSIRTFWIKKFKVEEEQKKKQTIIHDLEQNDDTPPSLASY